MIAVAKGERKAPAHAAEPSVHSAEVLARLLTPENRQLMLTIRDDHPQSIAHLAELTHRASPNVKRTLDKLEAIGLIYFRLDGRKRIPRMAAKKVTIQMNPFSLDDTITFTPANTVPSKPRRATH